MNSCGYSLLGVPLYTQISESLDDEEKLRSTVKKLAEAGVPFEEINRAIIRLSQVRNMVNQKHEH